MSRPAVLAAPVAAPPRWRRPALPAAERIPWSRIVLPVLAILYMAATRAYGLSIPRPLLLGLGGAIIAAILLKSLRDPTVILLALAAYIPFSRTYPGHFGGAITALNLTNVLTGIGILAWLVAAKEQGTPLFRRSPLNLPVALFALFSIIAFVRGGMDMGVLYWEGAIYNLKRWLDPFVVFFLFLGLIRRKETMRNLIVIIFVGVAVAAAMGVVEHRDLVERFPYEGERQRVQGISEQPNQFGAFLVYYGPLFLGLAAARPMSIRYLVLLVPFALVFRAAQFTGSRGTMLGVVAAVLCLCFSRSKVAFLGLALLAAVVVANPGFLPESTQRMLGRTFVQEGEDLRETLDRSAADRILLWEAALQMIREEPLWGVGYGGFPQRVSAYNPEVGYRDAHNTYLLIGAEMGLPALAVFLWMLGLVVWTTLRLYWRTPDRFFRGVALGFLSGLGGLLVVCMFGSRITSFEVFGYFWILTAIILRADALERAERMVGLKTDATVAAPWVRGVPART